MANKHYRTKVPNPRTMLLHTGDQLTYKELVTLLDEDFIEPTNSSRKKQLKDFEKLFSYSKGPGRKFTINEIYPVSAVEQEEVQKNEGVSPFFAQKKEAKPVSVLPERIANPHKYTETHRGKYYLPFANILLCFLAQKYSSSMNFLPTQLFEACGITNFKYSITDHNHPYQFPKHSGTASGHEVHWFYQNTYSKFRNIVQTQLQTLEALNAIVVTDSFLLFNHEEGFFIGTDKEIDMIREAQKDALEHLQMDTVAEVILHNKSKQFYEQVFDELPKNFPGEKYYSSYDIKVADWVLEQITPITEEEAQKWRRYMNSLIISSFTKTISRFYSKYTQEKASDDKLYYSHDFVETEQKLVDALIRIDDGRL